MKIVEYQEYGPPEVLSIKETQIPVPAVDEIRIHTRASTVTSGDWRARSLEMPPGFAPLARLIFGFTQPRQPVLGSEIAGVVDAVGDSVTKFKVGDRVFAFFGSKLGCYTEYKCCSENAIVCHIPGNLNFEEAAVLPFGGHTVLHFFRKSDLKAGESILINGASGGVGSTAIQIAKVLNLNVTAVCSSRNLEMVKHLGADRVLDYDKEDFANLGDKFDVIMDTVGTAPYSRAKHALKAGGRLLLVLGKMSDMFRSLWVSKISNHAIIAGAAEERLEDIQELANLANSGQLKPFIDRSFSIEDVVEAHRYVDTGRKRGNVALLWPGNTHHPRSI